MIAFRFVLYTQKTVKKKYHPVLLVATDSGQRRRISTGIAALPSEWDGEKSRLRKNAPGYKSNNEMLDELSAYAQSILTAAVMERKKLTLDDFVERFKNESKTENVIEFYEQIIKELRVKENIGLARTRRDTMLAIQRVAGKKFTFADVDVRFLTGLEMQWRLGGAKEGGISVYMRDFRAVYNTAINRGLVDQSLYPFKSRQGGRGYDIGKLKSKRQIKALLQDDLSAMKTFDYEQHPKLAWAYKMFMFSYYQVGVSFCDQIRLTKENIQVMTVDGVQTRWLVYEKMKVHEVIRNPLHPEAEKILQYFADNYELDGYLFPVLSSFHQTAQQKQDRTEKKRKQMNRALKRIAEILGINLNVTTYVARHTSAVTMVIKNVPQKVISKKLGHKRFSTTDIYTDFVEDKYLKEGSNVL